ncbi:DgyrCDS9590 [Dimorphilus gyrociliatus]|uniref:DgyrCDS9590 n=1 Tax=Dimorphilus gyrociliatus TaxID=2664684 RepID=A0A7I8VYQ5_9ANNE|nr:DgyrCDS9590 [Dimorphilus gyrociliatus]
MGSEEKVGGVVNFLSEMLQPENSDTSYSTQARINEIDRCRSPTEATSRNEPIVAEGDGESGVAPTNNMTSGVLSTNNGGSEVAPENEESEIVTKIDESNVIPNNSGQEVAPKNEKNKVVTINEESLNVLNNNGQQVALENEESKVVTESNDITIVPNNSKSEVAPESEESEIVIKIDESNVIPNNSGQEVAPKNEKNEVVTINEESLNDLNNNGQEVALENEKNEIVIMGDKITIVLNNSESGVASTSNVTSGVLSTNNDGSEVAPENEESEIITISDESLIFLNDSGQEDPENEESEIITISDESLIVLSDSDQEVGPEDGESEIITISDESLIVPNNYDQEVAPENETNEVVTITEESLIVPNNDENVVDPTDHGASPSNQQCANVKYEPVNFNAVSYMNDTNDCASPVYHWCLPTSCQYRSKFEKFGSGGNSPIILNHQSTGCKNSEQKSNFDGLSHERLTECLDVSADAFPQSVYLRFNGIQHCLCCRLNSQMFCGFEFDNETRETALSTTIKEEDLQRMMGLSPQNSPQTKVGLDEDVSAGDCSIHCESLEFDIDTATASEASGCDKKFISSLNLKFKILESFSLNNSQDSSETEAAKVDEDESDLIKKSSDTSPFYLQQCDYDFDEEIRRATENSKITHREEEEKRNNQTLTSNLIDFSPSPTRTRGYNFDLSEIGTRQPFVPFPCPNKSPIPADNDKELIDFFNDIDSLSINCFDPLGGDDRKQLEKYEQTYLRKPSEASSTNSTWVGDIFEPSFLQELNREQSENSSRKSITNEVKGGITDETVKREALRREEELFERYERKRSLLIEESNLDLLVDLSDRNVSSQDIFNIITKRIQQESLRDENSKYARNGLVIGTYRNIKRQHRGMTIKITIYSDFVENGQVSFTSDLCDSIQEVLRTCFSRMTTQDILNININRYFLKVDDRFEFLPPSSDLQLAQFDYVHYCLTYNQDIVFRLICENEIQSDLRFKGVDRDAKTYNIRSGSIRKTDIFNENLTCNEINNYLKSLYETVKKIKEMTGQMNSPDTEFKNKYGELFDLVDKFNKDMFKQYPSILESVKSGLLIELKRLGHKFLSDLDLLVKVMKNLVSVYCQMRCLKYDFKSNINKKENKNLPSTQFKLKIPVAYFHSLNGRDGILSYELFGLCCNIYYNGKELPDVKRVTKFSPREGCGVIWDEVINFGVPINKLPREARLHFRLLGKRRQEQSLPYTLASGNLQLFDDKFKLRQGPVVYGMWPKIRDNYVTPTGTSISTLETSDAKHYVLVEFHFDEFQEYCIFPEFFPNSSPDLLSQNNDYSILWKHRNYLCTFPAALPLVLHSCPSWSHDKLSELYSMLQVWQPPSPEQAVQLLLPIFQDSRVRSYAIEQLSKLTGDELRVLLPQLIQAVKFESYHHSELVEFLLAQSIQSIRFAHDLYWLLFRDGQDGGFRPRYELLFGALISIISPGLQSVFKEQERYVKILAGIAHDVKRCQKDEKRKELLQNKLSHQDNFLIHLPLNVAMRVNSFVIKDCDFFRSKTFPIKLCFNNVDNPSNSINVIFKDGDDLRQDTLVMQLIDVMVQLWRKRGLHLPVVTFRCLATTKNKGLIEYITNSETLGSIHKSFGIVTGPFQENSILKWLQLQNNQQIHFEQAVDNFLKSCAAYCVAMYVLAVGDRHNDNIMIKKSGQLFHIDFGKYLGDTEKFLNQINRDRAPFIFTQEMKQVINRGSADTEEFQIFIDYCCDAFNILRQEQSLLLSLFAMMSRSGVPNVDDNSLRFIHQQLNFMFYDLKKRDAKDRISDDAEGAFYFTQLIRVSLGDISVSLNFLVHNLANSRVTSTNDSYFSFQPKKYTMREEGKITRVQVNSIRKLKSEDKKEEKLYFVLAVEREQQCTPNYVFRKLSEIKQLRNKLTENYSDMERFIPDFAVPSILPKSIFASKESIYGENRRKVEIFLNLLFMEKRFVNAATSDITHTFFHPTLLDETIASETYQQNASSYLHDIRPKPEQRGSLGQIKFSVYYEKNTLKIFIQHVKLCGNFLGSGQPNPYVKTYLQPDPGKKSKIKTFVVPNSLFPTYNSILHYERSREYLRTKALWIAVWNHTTSQHYCIGGHQMDLNCDLPSHYVPSQWYPLEVMMYS